MDSSWGGERRRGNCPSSHTNRPSYSFFQCREGNKYQEAKKLLKGSCGLKVHLTCFEKSPSKTLQTFWQHSYNHLARMETGWVWSSRLGTTCLVSLWGTALSNGCTKVFRSAREHSDRFHQETCFHLFFLATQYWRKLSQCGFNLHRARTKVKDNRWQVRNIQLAGDYTFKKQEKIPPSAYDNKQNFKDEPKLSPGSKVRAPFLWARASPSLSFTSQS